MNGGDGMNRRCRCREIIHLCHVRGNLSENDPVFLGLDVPLVLCGIANATELLPEVTEVQTHQALDNGCDTL